MRRVCDRNGRGGHARLLDNEEVGGAGHAIHAICGGEHHVAIRPEKELAAMRGEPVDLHNEITAGVQVRMQMEVEGADSAYASVAWDGQPGQDARGIVEAGRDNVQVRGAPRLPAGQVVCKIDADQATSARQDRRP